MWGTWWVWDARLTSVLILFFLYLGYMALAERLRRSGARHARGRDPGPGRLRQRADHQVLGRLVEHAAPAGERRSAPAAPASTPPCCGRCWSWPLGFTTYYLCVLLLRLRAEIVAGKIRGAAAAPGARLTAMDAGDSLAAFLRDGRLRAPTSGRPSRSTAAVLVGLLLASVRGRCGARETDSARLRVARCSCASGDRGR